MNKELFNPKTIERLSKKIKITSKHKNAAKSWLYFLEEGKLEKEKLNYFKFGNFILQDLLGYDTSKMSFEEGFIEFSFKDKEGKHVLGIEAKGTKTKDLFADQKGSYKDAQKTPIDQLWNYMGKLDLDYGIATNYKDFVLIDRSKGHSVYHYFDFESVRNNDEKLKEFISIFSKEQIIDNNFVEKLVKESEIEERNFTKEFYKLFHETRLMLIKEFQEEIDTDEAIHFAQLYLNRLMFVFFAEDTGKLDKRYFEDKILQILSSGVIDNHSSFISAKIKTMFRELDNEIPKQIKGFNGGLFKEVIPTNIGFKDIRDKKYFLEIYQNSNIKKELDLDAQSQTIFNKYQNTLNPIIKNLLVMASFDFNTEVSVNILGHIFEQSLNDLEELKEEGVSKRKKDGVFYTPEYITDYICRNTIIPYLSKTGKAKSCQDLIFEYEKDIFELEKKFKEIKILDPACGSGAFLIKAVDILLEIHKEIQLFKQDEGEYTAIKKGRKKKKDESGQLMLAKWHEEDEARNIIENNIHGVDINEESIEITKLSLFLKIATGNRKLIDLSKNIKCGNSLIDDFEVDLKAFHWESEFKEIFDKGGFDIVIGNPPYVRIQNLDSDSVNFYESEFDSAKGNFDLYLLFIEKGFKLLKDYGRFAYINPNKFFQAQNGFGLRNFLIENKAINFILNFGCEQVFETATTYTCILFLRKCENKMIKYGLVNNLEDEKNNLEGIYNFSIQLSNLNKNEWYFLSDEEKRLMDKILKQPYQLKDISEKISQGFKTGADKIFINSEVNKFDNEKDILLNVLKGEEIQRYEIINSNRKAIFPYKKEEADIKPLIYEQFINYKTVHDYLIQYKSELLKRDKGKIDPKKWFLYSRNQFINLAKKKKIITRDISKEPSFALDIDGSFGLMGGYGILLKENIDFSYESLIAILNSDLVYWFISKTSTFFRGGYYSYEARFIENIPLPKLSLENISLLKNLSDNLRIKNLEIRKIRNKIIDKLKILTKSKIPQKIQNFENLDFNEFLIELKKIKILLKLKEQDEWQDYFEENKDELLSLKDQISNSNNEINKIVYTLYDINEEEKKIIEESLK